MEQVLERVRSRTAKIVVIGQGYVGLPVAMRAVDVGYDVDGFDVSIDRAVSLKNGTSFVGDVSD